MWFSGPVTRHHAICCHFKYHSYEHHSQMTHTRNIFSVFLTQGITLPFWVFELKADWFQKMLFSFQTWSTHHSGRKKGGQLSQVGVWVGSVSSTLTSEIWNALFLLVRILFLPCWHIFGHKLCPQISRKRWKVLTLPVLSSLRWFVMLIIKLYTTKFH